QYTRLINSRNLGVGPHDVRELRIERAEMYLKINQPKLALVDIDYCLKDGSGASVYRVAGETDSKLGEWQKAAGGYTKGIPNALGATNPLRANAASAKLFVERANVYDKLGKHDLAEQDRTEVKRLNSFMYDTMPFALRRNKENR